MNKINDLFSILSFGVQTISDNSLIKLTENIISYPFEGNIIIEDLENKIIKKTFLSPSMIKTINLIEENLIFIACETGEIFIFDYLNNKVIQKKKIRGINNIYYTSINNDFILICHHSILGNNSEFDIIHNNDGITLLNYKDLNILWTKKLQNSYSILNEKNQIITIYYSKELNYLTLYNKEGEVILDKKVEEIKYNIKKVKKISNDLIIIQTSKRYMYIMDINNITILNSIYFEGNGELGEFTIEELKYLIIANKSGQLIKIDIHSIEKENIISNDVKPFYESNIIRGYNWGFLSTLQYFIISNETGFYILNKQNKEYIYRKNIFGMSGCGVSNLKNNTNIFGYGDLKGNLIIYDNKTLTYKQIEVQKGMIRSITNDNNNNFVLGTMSGKLYQYNYLDEKEPKLIISDDKIGGITCMKFYNDYFLLSTTNGLINIYDKNFILIYSFTAHEAQKNNKNDSFGSLHLKSEIWSFDTFTKSQLNDNNKFHIATGSEDQSIKIHCININENKIISSQMIKTIKDNNFAVTCIKWNICNNKEIILSCSDDHTINLYNPINNFENILRVDFSKIYFSFFTLTYCAIDDNNPLNKYIVVGTQVGFLIIYDLIENKIKFCEKIHYGGIEGLSFSNGIISTCSNDCSFSIIKINSN